MNKLKSVFQNIIYILLLYAFIICVKEYISKSNTYKVLKTNIYGNNFVDSNILKNNIEHLIVDEFLYKVDIKKIKDMIEKNDYISSCMVSINLPSSINIKIKEIEPIAITTIDDNTYFIKNDMKKVEATINAMNYFNNLPVITNLTEKEIDLRKIEYILKNVINKSNSIYEELNEIRFTYSEIILVLDNQTKIIMANNNYKQNLNKFFDFNNQILSKDKEYLKKYDYVNMKVPNQIITNEKQVKI